MKNRTDRIFYRKMELIVFCIGVLYLRTISESREHLSLARMERAAGHTAEAIGHYRRASSFHSPGNSWAKEAAQELYDLAQNEKDPELKKDALRELRSSYLASDFGWNIFDLRSKELFQKVEAELSLESKPDPSKRPARNVFGFLSGVAFLGWILGVITIIWRVASPAGANLLRRNIALLSITSAMSFILWMIFLKIA